MSMIAQVLNRKFMLEQLADVRTQLAADVADGREGGDADPGLGKDDYAEALAHIEQALEKETAQSSGQPGYEPPQPERRSDWPAELDDYSFLSRDPTVSLVQSAIELYFDHPDNRDEVTEEELADDQRRGPDDEPAVTNRSLSGYEPSRDDEGRRVFDQFSITDIRWIDSVVAKGVRWLRKPRAFNDTPPPSAKIAGDARVILVGDWGSGLPRAQKVAKWMRAYVEECVNTQRDVHVMHLGDVYYSGWDFEYQTRVLPYWPVKPAEAEKVGSWCLNGNHDMYSGGYGYFDTLLKDPRFAKQGQASFFHLLNDDWQLIGLDTAWDDNGLKEPQADFVNDWLERNPHKKAIALSHHQFFSAYEPSADCGKVLREKLSKALEADRIHAAFWGHEHRCVLHEPFQNIKYGRLVGHGGVPVYMTHSQDVPFLPPVTYEDRRFIDKGLEHWALFGFAVLDFAGPKLHVRYVDEDGHMHKEETLE